MHDVNGKPLAVGDEVILRAKITGIYPGANFCNVAIEAVHPMPTGKASCRKCGCEVDPATNTTGAHSSYDYALKTSVPCDGRVEMGRLERYSSVNTKMLEKVEK